MAGLIWREHKLVILLDALDEGAEADGTNPLASLISGRFLELPEWIGFVVTSRPDATVVGYLQGFKPFAIEAGDARNSADLQAYSEAQVAPLLAGMDASERTHICLLLVEKSAGMMLYMRLVAEGLQEGTLEIGDLETLDAGLPGLHSRYHAAFEARFRQNFKESVQPLLRLVMAAPGPIPLDLATEILGLDRETAVQTRALIASYLVEDSAGLSLFHKTLGEWMGSEKAGMYFTDSEPAAKRLGEFLWECFNQREKNKNDLTKPFHRESFVSDWLPKLVEFTERNADWDSICDLASWFEEKIQFNIAETLYHRALQGRENLLGAEHPDTLRCVNSLGILLTKKGDYEGAEALCRRALEGREKTLGAEHPDTLMSANNLGNLLHAKRDNEGSEALYRRALEGREKTLGADNPNTMDSVNNLGIMLSEKGDYEGAEVFYRRALEGYEKLLGVEHPNTLRTVNNLGNLLTNKCDYEEAEALYRRALESYEKLLGVEHPETLWTVNNLANLLQSKGEYEGAEALYRRALQGRESLLGPEHPDTLWSIHSLGTLLDNKGDYDGAEVHYRSALFGREKILGAGHPYTLTSDKSLRILLMKKAIIAGTLKEASSIQKILTSILKTTSENS
jgi:tetratricopeptide (TPR) repeat protein